MTNEEHAIRYAWAKEHFIGTLHERDGAMDELRYQVRLGERLSMNEHFAKGALQCIKKRQIPREANQALNGPRLIGGPRLRRVEG